jgi:hypothetical protein
LAITDLNFIGKFKNKQFGQYDIGVGAVLCISLASVFDDGFCYKVVASGL